MANLMKILTLPDGGEYIFNATQLNSKGPEYYENLPMATCSTAAGTVAKTATINGFSLVTGARALIKFTYANTASNPTLNIGGTGAKSIYYKGAAVTSGQLKAGYLYEFIYNGTQYEIIGQIDTDTDLKTASENTTDKIYLIGATQQSTEGQRTYSNVGTYVDNGILYSNSSQVVTKGDAGTVYPPLQDGVIPTQYIPGTMNDVVVRESLEAFPETGENDSIYVDKTTKKSYIWDGENYIDISSPEVTNLVVASTSGALTNGAATNGNTKLNSVMGAHVSSISVKGTGATSVTSTGAGDIVINTPASNNSTITIQAGTGLAAGGDFTLNQGSNETITLNHSNSVTAGTASEGGSTRTLSHGGKFNVPSVTYDAQGHITGKGSVALTLPSETAVSVDTLTSGTSTLSHGGTFTVLTSAVKGDTSHNIDVTPTKFTLPSETAISVTTGTAGTTALSHGGTFTVLTAAAKGTASHNITVTPTTFTLPADKYHTTGSWSGFKYTATANGSAGELSFTLPTTTTVPVMDGTAATGTATTVARSDHKHPTDTSRAPTNHASTATTYGVGTTTKYGHVMISNGDCNTVAHADGLVAGMDHTHGDYADRLTAIEAALTWQTF